MCCRALSRKENENAEREPISAKGDGRSSCREINPWDSEEGRPRGHCRRPGREAPAESKGGAPGAGKEIRLTPMIREAKQMTARSPASLKPAAAGWYDRIGSTVRGART